MDKDIMDPPQIHEAARVAVRAHLREGDDFAHRGLGEHKVLRRVAHSQERLCGSRAAEASPFHLEPGAHLLHQSRL